MRIQTKWFAIYVERDRSTERVPPTGWKKVDAAYVDTFPDVAGFFNAAGWCKFTKDGGFLGIYWYRKHDAR